MPKGKLISCAYAIFSQLTAEVNNANVDDTVGGYIPPHYRPPGGWTKPRLAVKQAMVSSRGSDGATNEDVLFVFRDEADMLVPRTGPGNRKIRTLRCVIGQCSRTTATSAARRQ